MANEWQDLTHMTQGKPFRVERVRMTENGVAIEGDFEPPPLARLPMEDQIFIMAFVRCHGSIKEMERLFGVSYPTVKNRLNRIAGQFEFVEIDHLPPRPDREWLIERLERGEMTADEVLRRLEPGT